jgi:hypothetical protein
MEILHQKITLEDSCRLIGAASDAFAPLKEAITNSLDAISQRHEIGDVFIPVISVSIHFIASENLFGEGTSKLDFISVEDNGIGFTASNLERFKEFGGNTKGMNNRGTGKIQIFCRFNRVSIKSIFKESEKWHKLNVSWEKTGRYENVSEELESQEDTKTIVKMSGFSGEAKEQELFVKYADSIDKLKQDILKHFLLRIWLGKACIKICTFTNNTQSGECVIEQSNIPAPDKEETIEIDTQQAKITYTGLNKDKIKIDWESIEPKHKLTIHRFKMPSSDIDENIVYMCSKDIAVERIPFNAIKRKKSVFDDCRYLSSIKGDILDNSEHVNHAVDKFNFPTKKEVEAEINNNDLFHKVDKSYIFRDEINDKINKGLARIYSDVEELKRDREDNIVELAKRYAIPLEDAEAANANIAFNATDDDVTETLFKTQAKRLAQQSIKIYKTYEDLKALETKELDPTSEEYRIKFKELSDKLLTTIPEQNKDELARYIVRRDIVVDLLKLALNNELAIQEEYAKKKSEGEKVWRDREGIIHDLIFKRRMKGVPNDLWILNEEFVHFNGYSDIRLEEIEINGEKLLMDNIDIEEALKSVGIKKDSYSQQRPDIFIFPEEGKCVLVELKAPDEDLTLHTSQLPRYARLIANYSRKPRHFKHFFGFLIGEYMDIVNITSEWMKVPFGNYRIYPSTAIKAIDETEAPIANMYQEIIPLSEIAKRAEIRNKSFADKLGIIYADIKKIQEKGQI